MIGSGKTAVGRAIARKLRWPFFDLDQIMEKEAGKRIHDIVAKETWLGFREREYQICKKFSKMESYSKKQLKIHKNACCFCSASSQPRSRRTSKLLSLGG